MDEAGLVATDVALVIDLVVEGITVDEAVEQSKPIECSPTEQVLLVRPLPVVWVGYTTVTDFAPPHWLFFTTEPLLKQDDFCLQVEPSPMEKWNSRSQSNSTETWTSVTEKAETDLSEPQPKLGEELAS